MTRSPDRGRGQGRTRLSAPVIARRRQPRSARSKTIPRARLSALGRRLRREGFRIAFANGCFDLLHPGHVALLEAARAQADVLVVGLNSDRSVRGLKGPGRPILSQRSRAMMLAALEAVDFVTVFREATPLETIRQLGPDVLVKGSDWKRGEIVGREEVEARGGRVVRVRLSAGHSTSRLLGRLRRP